MGQEAEMPQIPQKKEDTGMFAASLAGETVKTQTFWNIFPVQ